MTSEIWKADLHFVIYSHLKLKANYTFREMINPHAVERSRLAANVSPANSEVPGSSPSGCQRLEFGLLFGGEIEKYC